MINNEIHLLSELLQKYVDDSGEVIPFFLAARIPYNWVKYYDFASKINLNIYTLLRLTN